MGRRGPKPKIKQDEVKVIETESKISPEAEKIEMPQSAIIQTFPSDRWIYHEVEKPKILKANTP